MRCLILQWRFFIKKKNILYEYIFMQYKNYFDTCSNYKRNVENNSKTTPRLFCYCMNCMNKSSKWFNDSFIKQVTSFIPEWITIFEYFFWRQSLVVTALYNLQKSFINIYVYMFYSCQFLAVEISIKLLWNSIYCEQQYRNKPEENLLKCWMIQYIVILELYGFICILSSFEILSFKVFAFCILCR